MRRKLHKKLDRLREVLREGGLTALKYHLIAKAVKIRERIKYQRWIRKHDLNAKTKDDLQRCIEGFHYRPLISILLPVYDVDEKWLRICIESVLGQNYPNWELCIADDASKKPHVREVIEEYAISDKRVKTVFRTENGHISAASNSALELATGEFTVLLDHDDELSPDALFWVANELNEFPDAKMIYSDEDLIDEKGKRSEPKFKPDFSRDLMYSLNLVTHLSAYSTGLLKSIGGFRVGSEGSQDYDLALRVIERVSEQQIRHIPRILYHWRAIPGSVAFDSEEKPYAHERAREAIRSHFERIGKKAVVSRSVYNLHRVQYELPEPFPKVALITNTSGFAGRLLDHVTDKISYPNFEIVEASGGCRAEALNQDAEKTRSDIICFLDSDLSPLTEDWLTELVRFAYQDEIGAVGAKILYSDGLVMHGGVIIGMGGLTGSAYQNFQRDDGSHLGRNQLVSNFSAVSVSCMVIRRKVFEEAGGFNVEKLPNSLFDADLCLRLGERGYRIVLNPFAALKRKTRGRKPRQPLPTGAEAKYFSDKWKAVISKDPFYNPNLSKTGMSFSIKV